MTNSKLVHLNKKERLVWKATSLSNLKSQSHTPTSGSQTSHHQPQMNHFYVHQSEEQNLHMVGLQISAHSCTCLWPRRHVYQTWTGPYLGAVRWPPCRTRKKHTPLMIIIKEGIPCVLEEEEDAKEAAKRTQSTQAIWISGNVLTISTWYRREQGNKRWSHYL